MMQFFIENPFQMGLIIKTAQRSILYQTLQSNIYLNEFNNAFKYAPQLFFCIPFSF